MPAKKMWALFEGARGPDGQVRAGVWDRVCVPGDDEKDGQSTSFNLETLSEMVDNFVNRTDQIPLDFNHQSNYSHINGQPAPALAWYGALAVVWGGRVVKVGCAKDVQVTGAEKGLDLSRDGLWAYRCEVTELGNELLPNFKYVSPTFLSKGTARDGTEVGYCLAAVAATNTPWQGETQLTFEQFTSQLARDPTVNQALYDKNGRLMSPGDSVKLDPTYFDHADTNGKPETVRVVRALTGDRVEVNSNKLGTFFLRAEETARYVTKMSRLEDDVTATPDGKPGAVSMRVEQRGSEWVVLPESGDKVLGKHKTKEEADKQLAAIEASKAAQHQESTGSAPVQPKEARMAAKFQKYAKFAGAAEGADDTAIKAGLGAKLGKLAQEAMEDEAFKYDEQAASLREQAAAMAGEPELQEEMARFQKMAARFEKMAKFESDDKDEDEAKKMEEEKAKMAKLEAEKGAKDAAMEAKFAAMEARLQKFERQEAEREKAERTQAEQKFAALADAAIAGGYPKSKRDSLITFARSNFADAAALVEPFTKSAPPHLFSRLTGAGGAPVGHGREAREENVPAKPRRVTTAFGTFVEDDGAYADKIKALAESKDAVEMAKVDRLLPEAQRPMMFHRLIAAQKIVRAEHPDLAEQADE